MTKDDFDNPPTNAWPPADQAAKLHCRLIARDSVAPSDFAVAYLDPLVAYLRATNPRADDHACRTAAIDTVMSMCKNPEQYNPAGRSLAGYLRMSADADMKNVLAKEKRHHKKRENRDPVEIEEDDWNSREDGDDLPSFDHPALAAVIAAFTDAERRVFELLREGKRQTAAFVAALGLEHLTSDEQACEVKRVKDKIKVRFKRAVEERP